MPKIEFAELIVYEDDNYIIVNKPPFVSTLADRNSEVNLLGMAKAYVGSAQACHRLDKETSGIIAFSKVPEAYRHLAMQFEGREVEKIYHAICDGVHNFNNLQVELPILPLKKGVVKIDFRNGKPAETFFDTLTTFRMNTLVSCKPTTGRMHQIRIHLSKISAPITGDDQYGGKPLFLSSLKRKFNLKKETEELPIMGRVALHAYSLSFFNMDGKRIKIEAPYPKDFAILLKQLEKYS